MRNVKFFNQMDGSESGSRRRQWIALILSGVFPGLGRLDDDDNLLVTTEFRNLYATVLESWMGVDPQRIIPGVDPRRVAIVK